MNQHSVIRTLLEKKSRELKDAMASIDDIVADVEAGAHAILDSMVNGGKVLVAGNGGSAAEAQHFTSELTGRFMQERRGLPAICLHGDTSAITSISNDYGYEHVFARQVEALGKPGDVLMVLSTSGTSQNLIQAVRKANELSMTTIGLLGSKTKELHQLTHISIAIPSDYQPAVQEMHLFVVHAMAEIIEAGL